jgi:hypothetical protein
MTFHFLINLYWTITTQPGLYKQTTCDQPSNQLLSTVFHVMVFASKYIISNYKLLDIVDEPELFAGKVADETKFVIGLGGAISDVELEPFLSNAASEVFKFRCSSKSAGVSATKVVELF